MWVLPCAALALVLWTRARVHADEPVLPSPAPHAPIAAPRSAAPEVVTVGLYLQDIHEIDIKSNSFTAELYLWFRWTGDIDPTQSFQITNAVNLSDLSHTPIYVDANGAAKPDLQPDGAHLQTFHVYGRFGHPFPLAKYPFDAHDIVISLEDVKHPSTELVHHIDTKGTMIRPDLTIPGWNLGDVQVQVGQTRYPTAFGDLHFTGDESYSRVDFVVHVERPVIGIVTKTMIPIAIILLITFGAFFCLPEDLDARLCLTITALISAVALQITAATELPPTGTLLVLDKIYILSYAAILAVTFCCIAVKRLHHADEHDRARQVDRWGLRLVAGGYLMLLVLLVITGR